jgi:hypothetical protein
MIHERREELKWDFTEEEKYIGSDFSIKVKGLINLSKLKIGDLLKNCMQSL